MVQICNVGLTNALVESEMMKTKAVVSTNKNWWEYQWVVVRLRLYKSSTKICRIMIKSAYPRPQNNYWTLCGRYIGLRVCSTWGLLDNACSEKEAKSALHISVAGYLDVCNFDSNKPGKFVWDCIECKRLVNKSFINWRSMWDDGCTN